MNTLVSMLRGTPWWVYLLFFYLLSIGISALRPSVVSILKLAILPVLFTVLSVHTLMVSFAMSAITLAVWAGSLLLGILLGLIIASGFDYKIDRKHLLILLPGNWITLILIMLIFVSKYYFSYEMSVDPSVEQNLNFEFVVLGVSGVCTGLFVGRFICYLYHFFTAESVDLKAIDL